MLLFLIALAIVVFGCILCFVDRNVDLEFLWPVGAVMAVLGTMAILFMAIVFGDVNIAKDATIAENQQRYEILTYQLENDVYDNDNDIGKRELYEQIREWNEDLARNKELQNSVWVGMFYPSIYDQFEFISLP